MNKKAFQGTGTAMVTPFTAEGTIDEEALRRFVDFQILQALESRLEDSARLLLDKETI